MTGIFGFGYPILKTSNLTDNLLLLCEPMEFEIAGESDKLEATKYSQGKIVTAASALSTEKYTLKLGIEAITWQTMQIAYGELSGVTASVDLPQIKTATVPASTPYEISDTDIVTANVYATVTENGTWGKAKPLSKTTGTVAAGQFKVDTTNTKLTFHSSQAGAPIIYSLDKAFTNLESIGAETVATVLSAFSFSGIAYNENGPWAQVIIDKMTRASIPTLTISDVTKFDLEYDLVVTGSQRRPFRLYEL